MGSLLPPRHACHRGMSCWVPRYVADVILRVGLSAYYLVVKPCALAFHSVVGVVKAPEVDMLEMYVFGGGWD
eukprot:2015670-Pyramimonas_sp.AAC.1